MVAELRPYAVGLAVLAIVAVGSALARRAGSGSPDLLGPRHFAEAIDATQFLRGNIHTHTTQSDGDHPVADVCDWYREHGYAFVAITDHNLRTDPADLAELERPGSFVVLPGEEITTYAASGLRHVPVHVNALCHARTIGGGDFESIRAALSFAIGAVRSQGGVALVNHPNFEWALTADDLGDATGAQLLEIWSGHPGVHAEGDALRPSEETIWEDALASGRRFSAVAVDDMHVLDAMPADPMPGPGRAWIDVIAPETTRDAICAALARGAFVASTGVRIARLRVTSEELTVEPAGDEATVEFSTQRGVVARLRSAPGTPASYRLKGGEAYVRARLSLANGARAWTQAYFTER